MQHAKRGERHEKMVHVFGCCGVRVRIGLAPSSCGAQESEYQLSHGGDDRGVVPPRRGHRQFVEYQAWLCERAGAGLQRRHSEPQPAQSRERAGFIRRVEHYL